MLRLRPILYSPENFTPTEIDDVIPFDGKILQGIQSPSDLAQQLAQFSA